MSSAPSEHPVSPLREELRHLGDHWLLLLILGVALAIMGTFAIVSPFISTLATVAFLGVVLFMGAVLQLVNAVTCRNWRGFLVNLLGAVLYGVMGLIMMNHPIGAEVGLTLMLAAAFMVGGIFRIVVAVSERFHGWAYVMANGFITLFLGIFIWRHLPEAALWVLGTFVGIDLIFAGWSWIFLAFGIRAMAKRV